MEKKALRTIALGFDCLPDGIGEQSFSVAVSSLQQLGLVRAMFASGHIVVDAILTNYGAAYIAGNPGLCNPINWKLISALASAIAAVAAVAALFVSCSRLY